MLVMLEAVGDSGGEGACVGLAAHSGMTWSRAGLVSCAVYAAAAGVLQIAGRLFADDPKGSYVLNQLSVLPGLYAMAGTGLAEATLDIAWLNSIPAYFLVSLLVAYAVGWGLQRVAMLRRGALLAWTAAVALLLFAAFVLVPGLR